METPPTASIVQLPSQAADAGRVGHVQCERAIDHSLQGLHIGGLTGGGDHMPAFLLVLVGQLLTDAPRGAQDQDAWFGAHANSTAIAVA